MTASPTIDTSDRSLRGDLDKAVKRRMESRLSYYVDHPDRIDIRLKELDREWTVERIVQAKSGGLTACGLVLGTMVSRKWLALSAIGLGFLLQDAIQGGSPAYLLLRRLGIRTQREIEQERYALMALRGDFDHLHEFKNKLTAIFRIVGISSR